MNTVLAIDEATCAAKKTLCHWMPPPIAFSGTTTVSPGCSEALSELPDHKLSFAPITEPSARITKMDFLSATFVGPPDWLRYHFALLPGRYETAVGLNTWPDTITKLGRFGMTRVSPALTSTSADVFFQRLISGEIRMVTRPTGAVELNWVIVLWYCCRAISLACFCLGSVSGKSARLFCKSFTRKTIWICSFASSSRTCGLCRMAP